MWTTAQNVRDFLGVDMDTADDDILEQFIEIAQDYVKQYIQVRVLDEEPSGNFNGSNNTFTTAFPFFANTTGDKSISTLDFMVYGWPDEDDPFTRVELTINTFDPLRGIIKLETAPDPDDYEKITVDYSYYTKRIDWNLLELATSWKAAEIWVKREEFLVPETWSVGGKKIVQRQPWKYFEIEFNRVMDKIRALPMDKVQYAKLVFRPRESSSEPEVDTSAADEVNSPSGSSYTQPDLT